MSKAYSYDAGKDLLQRKVDISVEQFFEICPTAKQQMAQAMKDIKPGFKVTEVNTVKNEGLRKSSAYTLCTIDDVEFQTIVDTGSGGNIISKDKLDEIDREIEEASSLTMVVADGHESVPLGVVHDIPIKLG